MLMLRMKRLDLHLKEWRDVRIEKRGISGEEIDLEGLFLDKEER